MDRPLYEREGGGPPPPDRVFAQAARGFARAMEQMAKTARTFNGIQANLPPVPGILIPPKPLSPVEKSLLLARQHFTDEELQHVKTEGYVTVIDAERRTWAITCGCYQYRRTLDYVQCHPQREIVSGWQLYGVWLSHVPRLDSLVALKIALEADPALVIGRACRPGYVCHPEHCHLMHSHAREHAREAFPSGAL